MQHKWLGALAVILFLPAAGMAQTSASSAGYAFGEVQSIPITLTLDLTLLFGTFVPHGQAGWVAISPTNSPATTGSHVTIINQGRPARWSVTGTPNAPFTVTLPGDRTVTLTSGADDMVVDFFNTSYHETGTTPLLSSAGTTAFTTGAKLLVRANQSPGLYSGSFTVTVAY